MPGWHLLGLNTASDICLYHVKIIMHSVITCSGFWDKIYQPMGWVDEFSIHLAAFKLPSELASARNQSTLHMTCQTVLYLSNPSPAAPPSGSWAEES